MANNQPYVCIINKTGRYNGSEIQRHILQSLRADSNLTPETKINLTIKNNSSLQKIPKFSERVFKDFPFFLANVTKLSLIDTSGLKNLDSIDIFPNLEEINILRDDRFPIKYYDISSFTRLPNLKKISFKRIEFEIPGEFENLNLEDLDFDNCVFKDNKYDEICGIVSLKMLMLNNTKFIPPDNIDRLVNLEEYYHLSIDLPYESHGISGPDSANHNLIFNLPKIRFVDFTGQKFVINMDFRECQTLEMLAMGTIDITPDERVSLNEKLNGLSKFPNLVKLNLSALGIGILPRDINLEKLELLNLSFNHFVEIEEGILSNFPNLKSLILSDNILVSLPNDIGELRELESLFLYNNVELKEFPSSISNLTKLNELELRGCQKLIAEIRDIAGSDVKEPQEIIKLFAPGCPLRSLLVRNFNNNKNGSYTIRQALVRTKNESNSLLDVNLSDTLQVLLFDKNILGFLDQMLNYFEDKGNRKVTNDLLLTYQDCIMNGLFRVRLGTEVGIDAGGLYRQLLSDLNKEIEEQKFFEVKDGTLTTNIEDSNRLKGIVGIILMLYNSGEGIFRSDFKFGHAINLFRETWAYRDVREDLEPVLKDFAINILNEDKDKVKLLTKEDERLNTYLWLMNEYIEEGFKVQEGSSCETVLNANTIKEYGGMYDYIFLEADWREPSFELDLPLPPGATLNTNTEFDQENITRRINELRRRITSEENRNAPANENRNAPANENRNAPANENRNAPANENRNAPANENRNAPANENRNAPANENRNAPVNENRNDRPVNQRRLDRLLQHLDYVNDDEYNREYDLAEDVKQSILFLKTIINYLSNSEGYNFNEELNYILTPLETNRYQPPEGIRTNKLIEFYFDVHKLWEYIKGYPEQPRRTTINNVQKQKLHIQTIEYVRNLLDFLPEDKKEEILEETELLIIESNEIPSARSQFRATAVAISKYAKLAEAHILMLRKGSEEMIRLLETFDDQGQGYLSELSTDLRDHILFSTLRANPTKYSEINAIMLDFVGDISKFKRYQIEYGGADGEGNRTGNEPENRTGEEPDNRTGNEPDNRTGNEPENRTTEEPNTVRDNNRPVWQRDYESSDEYEEADPELLREHRRRIISILETKIGEIDNSTPEDTIASERRKLNYLKEVINSDRYFDSPVSDMIDRSINSIYTLLNTGEDIDEDKGMRILIFTNEILYNTIENLTLIKERTKQVNMNRFDSMNTRIMDEHEREKFVYESPRYNQMLGEIKHSLNNLFESMFYDLTDVYGDLVDANSEQELERRLPDFYERIRRFERHIGYAGEQYRIYPYQIIELNDELNLVRRELNGDSSPPSEETRRIMELAIEQHPSNDDDLEQITDMATEGVVEGLYPLDERLLDHEQLTLLLNNPQFVPRLMEIYYTRLGNNLMEQPVENWLATSNSNLREAVLEFLGLSTERAEVEVAEENANANEVAVAEANANEVAEADEVAEANEVAEAPAEENRISGEEDYPDISDRFTLRDENWRNNPRSVSAFRRNVESRRRDNAARQRNDNRIESMPYLDSYFRELYGDNWRQNSRTVTTFRRQATQEERQNNEELARRNPERLDSVERAFGQDWRSSMPARRVLRGLTPYPRGRGPQRGGANNENTNMVEEIGRWASRTGEDPFTSETLPEDMRTFIQERGEELRDDILEQIRYFVQQREARERFMQRQTAAPILSSNSNSNSNDSERFSSQKESLYKIDPKIIEAFKFYTDRHDTNTSQFLNKKNKKYVEPNIFLIYHIFSPNDDIDVELFKEKIRFSDSLPVTEKDIILETIDDHMFNISQEEERDLDTYVREESGGKLESFKLLIPNHRTFLTKLLEYWSGSMKLSEGTYRIFPRDGIVAMEAHTCFNELVLPRFRTKLDFLKLFVYSILTVGTTFGVAGRKLTKKGKKNKNTRQNKMTRKKMKKNRIDVSPDPGFKKIKSKRN